MSLQTCCSGAGFPASDKSQCADTVTANDASSCYSLLNEYLQANACSNVSLPEGGAPGDATTGHDATSQHDATSGNDVTSGSDAI